MDFFFKGGRENKKEFGLVVIMACQCTCVPCTQCAPAVGTPMGRNMCRDGGYLGSLSAQFCCKPETALKKIKSI